MLIKYKIKLPELRLWLVSFAVCLWILSTLASCGGQVEIASKFFARTFEIGGSVNGLQGSGLQLALLDGNSSSEQSIIDEQNTSVLDIIEIEMDGVFSFETQLPQGSSYSFAIVKNPTGPFQLCQIEVSQRKASGKSISSVFLNCSNQSYPVGGALLGLKGGEVKVQLNGSEEITVNKSGSFLFTNKIPDTANFSVRVTKQPSSPAQVCTAFQNSGIINGRAVLDVAVQCSLEGFLVSGFVEGLKGSGLRLVMNENQSIAVDDNTYFQFSDPVADQAGYNVQVQVQPEGPDQVCSVFNTPGMIGGRGVADILVSCSEQSRTLSGTVDSLQGEGLVLGVNGANLLAVHGNGDFTFPVAMPLGSSYTVSIIRQPVNPKQVCSLVNTNGVVTESGISNIQLLCDVVSYQVATFISGLKDTMSISNNETDILNIETDGLYFFNGHITDGGEYNIKVESQPGSPWQVCTVTDGNGNMQGSNSTSTFIQCINAYGLGGELSGLSTATSATGSTTGLVVRNNVNGELISITSNGVYSFGRPLLSGESYDLEIIVQPQQPAQICSFDSVNSSDSNVNSDRLGVDISCTSVAPVITALQVNPSSATLNEGDTVDFVFTFNEEIAAGGSAPPASPAASLPAIPLNSGGSAVLISAEDNPGNQLTFRYTVGPEDDAPVLDFSPGGQFEFPSGFMHNEWQVSVDLNLPSSGSALSISENATIIVDDISPPQLTILGPLLSTVSNPAVFYTNQSTVSLSGDCSLEAAGLGSTLGSMADNDCSNGDWATNAYALSTGSNLFSISAQDSQANIVSVDLDVVLDNTKPIVAISSSADPGPTNDSPIILSISFDEEVASFSIDDITLNGAVKGSFIINTEGLEYSLEVLPIGNGTIQSQVLADKVTDIAGNTNNASTLYSIEYDGFTTAPIITSPDNGSTHPNNLAVNYTLPETALADSVTLTLTQSGGVADAGSPHVLQIASESSNSFILDGADFSAMVPAVLDSFSGGGALVDGAIYTVAVSYQDTVGNSAAVTQKTNVNFIINLSAPTLDTVTIGSDNADPSLALVGDTITLNFTASEDISQPSVSIAGNIVTATGGPQVWSATYTMQVGDAQGNVAILIYNIENLASVPAPDVSSTTDSSNVYFDKSAPVLSPVSISSDNSNGSLAKVGDTVTVSFDAGEDINTPVVTIDGQGAAVSGGPQLWTADYIMQTGDNEGLLIFQISSLSDLAGNSSTNVSAVTDASSVTFDETIPVITSVGISSNNVDSTLAKPGDIVSVNFTSDSDLQTPTVTIDGNSAAVSGGPASWSASYTMTAGDNEGDIAFLISAISDLAGNPVSNISTVTDASAVDFDRTSPAVTITSTSSPGPTYDNPIEITITFDEVVSGFDVSDVSVAGASKGSLSNTTPGEVWTLPLVPTGDGTITADIAADAAADGHGNNNAAATQFSIDYDARPAVAISYDMAGNTTGPYNTGSLTITATYSEAVTAAPDISIDQQGSSDITAAAMTNSGDSMNFTYVYTVNEHDASAYIDGTAIVALSSVNDGVGNPSDTPSNTTFTISTIDVQISSAETMDADSDGRIDHYKLTFNMNVDDSSFPGYVFNSDGSPQSDWLVAAYGDVVLAHGGAAPETDFIDDAVLYLKFTESDPSDTLKLYDTAAKPDITTTATPAITNDIATSTLAQVTTVNINEADNAAAILTKAWGQSGGGYLTIGFSEGVDSTSSAGCNDSDTVADTDITYTNGTGSGAGSLQSSGWLDEAGCDGFVIAAVNSNFIAADVAGAGDSINITGLYDAAGLAADATTLFLSGSTDVFVARYAAAPNWLDRVRASDTNTACDGTEVGFYHSCLHGGEKRQVEVPGYTSCDNLSAVDSMNAFEWNCDDSVSPVRFVSRKLHDEKNLSDLIDWDSCPSGNGSSCSWKTLSLQVTESDEEIYVTKPMYWAANAITVTNQTGSISLNSSGTIYVAPVNVSTVFYVLSDTTALVVKPGAQISRHCCLPVVTMGSFGWVEGELADTSDGGDLLQVNGNFNHIREVTALEYRIYVNTNANSNYFYRVESVPISSEYGMEIEASEYNIFREVTISGTDESPNHGIRTSCTKCMWQRLKENNTSNWSYRDDVGAPYNIFDTLLVTNSLGGIRIDPGTGTAIIRAVTSVNHQNASIEIYNGVNTYIEDILNLNTKTNNLVFDNSDDFLANNIITGWFGNKMTFRNLSGGVLTGNLKVNNPTDCELTSTSGLGINTSCQATGASDFTLDSSFNINNMFFGKGATPGSGGWDYIAFGEDGEAFPSDKNSGYYGYNGNSDSGTYWDFTLSPSDTVARWVNSYPDDADYITHTWETPSAPSNQNDCDNTIPYGTTFVAGSPNTCQSTFLPHASEFFDDGVGNDNFLCEVGEVCLFHPNIGAYQGEVTDPDANCSFATTTVNNVKYCNINPSLLASLTNVTLLRYDTLSGAAWNTETNTFHTSVDPSNWAAIQTILQTQAALGVSGPETYSSFGNFSGSSKSGGGVLGANGLIYSLPDNPNTIMVINPSNDTGFTFASISGNDKCTGGALAPNGKIYCAPDNEDEAVVVVPNSNTTYGISGFGASGNKYKGAVTASNGKIYLIPHSETAIKVIDPSDDSVASFGNYSGTDKWYGGVHAPNGKIYGIPGDGSNVLVIDTSDDSSYTFGSFGASTRKYRSGALAPNGKIYSCPYNESNILVIDPSDDSSYTFGSISGSGNYSGATLAPNGLIYCVPFDADHVRVIDPTDDSTYTFGTFSGTDKYEAGILAPNGKIYCIPRAANDVLVIDPKSNGAWPADYHYSPYFNKF